MKKRVVAVMLSLTMCMATAAEAGVVSAADFSAEATADTEAENIEEPVADETEGTLVIDGSAEVSEPEDGSEDTVQEDTEISADTSDAESTDDTQDAIVDFSAGDEDTTAVGEAADAALTVEDEVAAQAGVTESVTKQGARLLYTRWESHNVNNTIKWKLKKPETVAVQSAETAVAVGTTEEETTAAETTESVAAEENSENTAEAGEVSEQAIPEAQVSEETAVQAGATSAYYTSADGIVRITTLNTDGSELFTAYYAFDKEGYLLTGKSLVGSAYYYFKTADETTVSKNINHTHKAPYNSELGQMVTNAWKWDGKSGTFDRYGADGCEEVIAANQVYSIDGASYYLQNDGVPYVGEKNIGGAIYCFRAASYAGEIPGKMVVNGWASVDGRWHYFGTDGKYQKKPMGAYKVYADSDDLYLLDANGSLIKGKMVKAPNGYYYYSNSKGVAYRDRLVKYGKYRYYFVSDGRRATWKNRWARCAGAGNRYYYFGKTPGCVQEKKGFQKITIGKKFIGWFYFSKAGNSYINTWAGGRYFLSDGRMASGVTKIGDKYYFFQRSTTKAYRGKVYKGTWIKYNNKYYYAASNGVLCANGWRRIKSNGRYYYYYFRNCTALTNRSIKRGDTYGSLDSKGRFISAGWLIMDNKKNRVRYMDPKTGKLVKNTTKVIDGINYRFDKYGNRVNDRTNEIKRSKYYLECDKTNGVMTVYADSARTLPIKTIRVSVGNPTNLTPSGTFTLQRSDRWQLLMGPSWGQYGTHVRGGIYVHSIACGLKNGNNLPAGEYLKLGSPASHGCIRCCVADAKWVYQNCNGSSIHIFDGTYEADEVFKGALGRNPITPLRGSGTFDPTDPDYANK